MSVFQAVVLGLVQGLTEFIPISSSGHLVIVPELAGWPHPSLAFDVWLHAGSLVALIAYFFKDLLEVLRGFVRPGPGRRLLLLLAVGTIPAAVAGLWLEEYFAGTFTDARSAAVQLVITAAILVVAERALARHIRRSAEAEGLRSIDSLGAADATAIGIAQAVAIFPGISRSGATIGTGLTLRMARDDAARFAFLLAVPALLGAAIVSVPDLGTASITAASGAAGFLASLVSSYAAIAGLIRFLRTRTLYPFAGYCLVAGIVFYLLI